MVLYGKARQPLMGRAIWTDSHIGPVDRMKRSIFASLMCTGLPVFCIAVALGLGACSSPQKGLGEDAPETSGWVTPPSIDRADRTAQGLMLRGMASPSGRVVVRGEGDIGYATGADQTGRFVLRIAAPLTDTLFVVETQSGQDAFPSPDRLLVAHGIVALLTPGGASRRLDQSGPLAAIDTDGRTTIASGQTNAGASIPISLDGGMPTLIRADTKGRWMIPVPAGTSTISIGVRLYVLPPLIASGAKGFSIQGVGDGLSVTWTIPGGASQTTWLPVVS